MTSVQTPEAVQRPDQRSGRGARATPSRGTVPWPLGIPALLAVLFLLVPLAGLLVRAPWRGLPRVLGDSQVLEALRLSLVCASAATVLSLLLGVPLAWVLARTRVRGITLLRALVTLPLVLPPVVGGVALLLAFGRQGILGRLLDEWTGITLPFTTAGVIVAETFVAMPFLVITAPGTQPTNPNQAKEVTDITGRSIGEGTRSENASDCQTRHCRL